MEDTFIHFVITRFNIRAKGWELDKNQNEVNNDEWLIDRIVLFETYCLPSFIFQTEKRFHWLVFFDIKSPDYLKVKIKEWERRCPNFVACFVENYEDFLNFEIDRTIKKYNVKEDFIITTRIDNDDAFHKDAIKIIQNNFKPIDNSIIDIVNGYCLSLEKRLVFKRKYNSNPFVSYIEKNIIGVSIASVMKEGHPAWEGKVPFISVNTKPLWIQVIHEKNVSNTIKGNIILYKKNVKEFGITFPFKFSFLNSLKQKIKINLMLFKHNLKILILRK